MSRLEKNRKSILTNDLSRCYVCGKPRQELHEVFYGRNRTNSMLYDCVVPLCYEHHRGNTGVHHNHELDIMLKQKCQAQFINSYPNLDFYSIFYKNYL